MKLRFQGASAVLAGRRQEHGRTNPEPAPCLHVLLCSFVLEVGLGVWRRLSRKELILLLEKGLN